MPYSDVAVFPQSTGGRGGVRVQTQHPDFLCILLMQTPTSLHGSVFPNSMEEGVASVDVSVCAVRVIHYGIASIDAMMKAMRNDDEALAHLATALEQSGHLSERLLLRLQAQLSLSV